MIAQNLEIRALGTQFARGIIGDSALTIWPDLGTVFLFGGNQELIGDAAVIGDDKADTALFLIATDHGCHPR